MFEIIIKQKNSFPTQETVENQVNLSSIRLSPLQKNILQNLRVLPLTLEQLNQELNAGFAQLNSELIKLELQGLVQCSANKWSAMDL